MFFVLNTILIYLVPLIRKPSETERLTIPSVYTAQTVFFNHEMKIAKVSGRKTLEESLGGQSWAIRLGKCCALCYRNMNHAFPRYTDTL